MIICPLLDVWISLSPFEVFMVNLGLLTDHLCLIYCKMSFIYSKTHFIYDEKKFILQIIYILSQIRIILPKITPSRNGPVKGQKYFSFI